jgi:hypothetical protein
VRRALLAFLLLLLLPLQAANGEPPWQTLPPTPAPVAGEQTGHAKVNGISLYYASIGHGSPVVLLHGGLSNSDYWGNQIKALAPHHTVMSWTAAATAAAPATPGRIATTSWPMTLSLCLIRCTSPRPTWSAGATAPSLASILPFAIQTASVHCRPRRRRQLRGDA